MISLPFPLFFLLLPVSNLILFLLLKQYYEKKASRTYQNLLQILDRAALGHLQKAVYDESMDAAITTRLNRILQNASMHQELAEKECGTVKALISNITHQIRTPLTNIMLYTGLLREQYQSSDAAQLINRLVKQADKLDFFIKELVKSSYTEQEMISIHPEKISVPIIIRTACQTMELAAMKKEITLEFLPAREPDESLLCYADQKWTTEAVSNVLENAIKYSPVNSVVQIQIVLYESFLCIQISDNGTGIREEEQGLVFERFYRSKDAERIEGFGIGLYLVRTVLSKQGGYAKIHSVYGKGTSVQLFLSRFPPF